MEIYKKLLVTFSCLLLANFLWAQQPDIHILHPYRSVINTSASVNYISGNTCKKCKLFINGKSIKVYPTGAFALQLNLTPGDTALNFKSINTSGQRKTKKLVYHYKKPQPEQPVSRFRIASVKMNPSGNCWLQPGDRIQIKIKAQPGNKVQINNRFTTYEPPPSQTGGMKGIYHFNHVVTQNDPLLKKSLLITLENKQGKHVSHSLAPQVKVLDPDVPVIGKTIGPIPYLLFGKGDDRLGGAKINYIDTAVLMHITGLFGNQYRVSLAQGHTAYIPVEKIQLLSKGTFIPHALSGSWKVWGDKKYDYVSIALQQRLPYTTFQKTDPARIITDIYGATANSNWITQLESTQEIKNVTYQQISDGILRVIITLKHHQQWGYALYYNGTNLVIRVKRQPAHLTLNHLTIAIDAGHGGRNSGAQGPTGVLEKKLTLQMAKKLQKLLTHAGAKVIMTRNSDVTKSMIDRILFLRKVDPNLLVSIHCNSSADPIHVAGTSTYYRYIGFRPLSQALLKQMTALDLHDFGNIGRFNFALNGPTEYPNALVETLFVSNPKDEMKLLNPAFQQKIAEAIKAGIQDFLNEAKK